MKQLSYIESIARSVPISTVNELLRGNQWREKERGAKKVKRVKMIISNDNVEREKSLSFAFPGLFSYPEIGRSPTGRLPDYKSNIPSDFTLQKSIAMRRGTPCCAGHRPRRAPRPFSSARRTEDSTFPVSFPRHVPPTCPTRTLPRLLGRFQECETSRLISDRSLTNITSKYSGRFKNRTARFDNRTQSIAITQP